MTVVYIEVILMGVLAIASVACIYLGLVLHQKKYAHHVVIGQLTKTQKRLLEHPYMYFICVPLFVVGCSWFLVHYMAGNMQQFYFGVLISLLSMALGQSIGGILVFLYSIRNSEKIQGQAVFEDQEFRVVHIQAAFMSSLVLLISLAIIQSTPFILGSLVAATGMVFIPAISMYKRQESA